MEGDTYVNAVMFYILVSGLVIPYVISSLSGIKPVSIGGGLIAVGTWVFMMQLFTMSPYLLIAFPVVFGGLFLIPKRRGAETPIRHYLRSPE
jgi:hypothetical protein